MGTVRCTSYLKEGFIIFTNGVALTELFPPSFTKLWKFSKA